MEVVYESVGHKALRLYLAGRLGVPTHLLNSNNHHAGYCRCSFGDRMVQWGLTDRRKMIGFHVAFDGYRAVRCVGISEHGAIQDTPYHTLTDARPPSDSHWWIAYEV